MISVITPTYNRANLLPGLYQSLCKQSYHDFEWIVVDDGSTDGTLGVIEKMKKEQWAFPIKYCKKGNGGKHTAINSGIRVAQGEISLILDSDDELPMDALENIERVYSTVRGDISFGGVCGMMAHRSGEKISCIPVDDSDYLDATGIDLRFKYHIEGDMCEVFRTQILREFPFPEIEGEKFCPEALVWNRIATKYKLRCFNKVIYHRDYLEGGLTDRIVKIRMKSPVATMMTYQEMTQYDIPVASKVKAAINYWRFRFCSLNKTIPRVACKWSWVIPVAYLLHLRDLQMTK